MPSVPPERDDSAIEKRVDTNGPAIMIAGRAPTTMVDLH
jgi:hypothetical protein